MAMDGIDAALAANSANPEGARAAGIFLHAGWRSCGTWIWERLRENAIVQAFYEPLHEDLARLRERDIGSLRPDSWQSGHGIGAPYFTEYAPLLRPRGGVRGHAARFAFDDYFRPPEQDDAELESYLRALAADAVANSRLPVLKFCRSLGRVPWLEVRFPEMLHVVILRDPLAQWRSARRQMELNGNRYFVVAPFVILARNANNQLLTEAAEQLAVKLPPTLGRSLTRDLSVTADACWRHVSRLSWQDRFRGFLALWIASGIASLHGTATLIDADRVSQEPETCSEAETALSRASGLRVDLMPGATYESRGDAGAAERADAAAPMEAALAFLGAHGEGLPDERAAVLASKLQNAHVMPVAPLVPGAVSPGPFAYADAAAYIALMRASYPLRRAHFHVRRWTADVKGM
jgi:hypothetical protein